MIPLEDIHTDSDDPFSGNELVMLADAHTKEGAAPAKLRRMVIATIMDLCRLGRRAELQWIVDHAPLQNYDAQLCYTFLQTLRNASKGEFFTGWDDALARAKDNLSKDELKKFKRALKSL